RSGTEVVQLYLHDPVAQTTRPVVRLVGYARVPLEPGEAAFVRFVVPADVALRFGRSSADVAAVVPLCLVGGEREIGHQRRLVSQAFVEPVAAPQPTR